MKVYLVYMENDWYEADHRIQDYRTVAIYEIKADAYARCFFENKKNNHETCDATGELMYQVEECDLL